MWFARFKWGYFLTKVRERSWAQETDVSWAPQKYEKGQLKAILGQDLSPTHLELAETF